MSEEPEGVAALSPEQREVRRMLLEGPTVVVADEAHQIKNSAAKGSKAMRLMRSSRRLALTGYPLQNNLTECAAALGCCLPAGLLPGCWQRGCHAPGSPAAPPPSSARSPHTLRCRPHTHPPQVLHHVRLGPAGDHGRGGQVPRRLRRAHPQGPAAGRDAQRKEGARVPPAARRLRATVAARRRRRGPGLAPAQPCRCAPAAGNE